MISKAGNKNGFLLIEISIVVVLILILLSISWPSLRTMSQDLALKLSSNKIMALLDNVREKSMVEFKYYILEFDILNNKYFVKKESKNYNGQLEILDQGSIIKNEFKNKLQIVNISGNKLMFNPDGTSENFFIILEDKKTQILIKITGLTGKCEVEKIKKI